MMPLLRVNRAGVGLAVGLEVSLMPSAPRGMDSLPPIVNWKFGGDVESCVVLRAVTGTFNEQDDRVHGHYNCRTTAEPSYDVWLL
jgi:hypothetical protein